MTTGFVPDDLEAYLKPVLLKDLRIQLRARGLNPAGGRNALADRLGEAMKATGDYTFKRPDGQVDITMTEQAISVCEGKKDADVVNNYHRPDGQNVGNFLTDRNSSRVLAPPGGGSQFSLAFDATPQQTPPPAPAPAPAPQAPVQVQQQSPALGSGPQTPQPPVSPYPNSPAPGSVQPPSPYAAPTPQPAVPAENPNPGQEHSGNHNNNYARPGGMQNVGNFLTDRNSSRVLAPPGGASSVSFG